MPDASSFSPDGPRYFSPDGQCSFIVPEGLKPDWSERFGFGELRLRAEFEPLVHMRVRVGRLEAIPNVISYGQAGAPQGEVDPRLLLTELVKRLAPDLPPMHPILSPQQGRLGRWPVRSVEVESDSGESRGWTAVALAKPLYVHLTVLAPKAQAPAMVSQARKFFHDLRIRPDQVNREMELWLVGRWKPRSGGDEWIVFDQAGRFRWQNLGQTLLGHYQVRGQRLVMRWGDSEKELQILRGEEKDGQRLAILGERAWMREETKPEGSDP